MKNYKSDHSERLLPKTRERIVNLSNKIVSKQFYSSAGTLRNGSRTFWIVLVGILFFCEASWLVFIAETDVARYQCYALAFWSGGKAAINYNSVHCAFLQYYTVKNAFHTFPTEYPPLTLLLFSLALLVPLSYYSQAFALLMSLIVITIFYLLMRFGSRNSPLLFIIYLILGACVIFQVRFDILPAFLTLLCILAAEHKQWPASYVALAFGVLFKFYPIVLVPSLFIAEQQSRGYLSVASRKFALKMVPGYFWSTLKEMRFWCWKHLLIFFVIVIGITGIFACLNFQGAVSDPIFFFLQRPIQVESLEGSLLWIMKFFGASWQIVFTYGSFNILSNMTEVVSTVVTICFIAGYLFILWNQLRTKMNLLQAMIALLLVLISCGKVFSPQYLIWIIPLLAYAGASRFFWWFSWGTLSFLTTFTYAYFYSRLTSQQASLVLLRTMPGFFETIALRDDIFVFVTLAYLFNWFHARQYSKYDRDFITA